MNAAAKRLRPKPRFHPPTQASSHPPTLRLPRQALDPVDVPLPVGFSHVRATQAYVRSVEETERDLAG